MAGWQVKRLQLNGIQRTYGSWTSKPLLPVAQAGVHLGLWLLVGPSIKVGTENPVVRLVVAGTRAEYEGRSDEARTLYREAWEAAGDDYEACIAAHYVARYQDTPLEVLRWNELALAHAETALRAADSRVADYFPSLYLSLGRAHENAGDAQRAQLFYDRAAALGVRHRMR